MKFETDLSGIDLSEEAKTAAWEAMLVARLQDGLPLPKADKQLAKRLLKAKLAKPGQRT